MWVVVQNRLWVPKQSKEGIHMEGQSNRRCQMSRRVDLQNISPSLNIGGQAVSTGGPCQGTSTVQTVVGVPTVV